MRTLSLKDDLERIAAEIHGELRSKGARYSIDSVIAERKSFLNKRKLSYSATVELDDERKEATFREMLKESGLGVSSGADDVSPGLGFKKEVYNTLSLARRGAIEEQSTLFAKKYRYTFDYSKVRDQVHSAAERSGYRFIYRVVKF